MSATPTENGQVTVTWAGGACPAQAEGFTPLGRPFYFRARNGYWSLEVGPIGAEDFWAQPIEAVVAEGEDETLGWMERDAVMEILNRELVDV